MTTLCAACGEPTPDDPCAACGASPLLVGRYRLVEPLGRGRSGTTYRAVRVVDGSVFAIKEMPLRGADSDKARALFQREARVLRELDHPRIPRHVEDFVAGRGKHAAIFLVEELIEGADLAREAEGRRYDEADVLDVLAELLPILGYLHGRSPPVIHRDLKPKNVMRRPDGALVLLDFGAVRDALVDSELGGSTVAGTFGYMAPEQFRGDATPASDLYGVGALAVALLTRREPNTIVDATGRLRWRSHANVSGGTATLLDRLLDPDADRRPRSAEAVLAEVRRLRGATLRGGSEATRAVGAVPPGTPFAEPPSMPPFVEPPPFAPPAPPAPPARRSLAAPLAIGAGAASVLGFLGWTLGAFLLASNATPPAPLPAPPAACVPTGRVPEDTVPDTTSRYGFVGGSVDGRRVAMALGRQSDGRGELVIYEAGGAVPLLERVVPKAQVRAPWESFLDTFTPVLRAQGVDPAFLPEPVAWCQDGASVRIDDETWRFDTFEAPCALGIGSTTSFQLCPPGAEASDACLHPPRLTVGCWTEAPRLVDVYRLGEAVWVVAERPHDGVVARFAAGIRRE